MNLPEDRDLEQARAACAQLRSERDRAEALCAAMERDMDAQKGIHKNHMLELVSRLDRKDAALTECLKSIDRDPNNLCWPWKGLIKQIKEAL
jgi:thioredoxin-like negative regulator of GroEL